MRMATTSYPFTAGDAPPRASVGRGACDTHIHVYDQRFATAAGSALTPPDAGPDDYLRVQKRLGLSRVVLVTPSTYGTDNSCMLEGLARMVGTARGVAVIGGHETDAELLQLHEAGVRGVRVNLALPGPHTVESIAPLADRIAPLGWHLQLLMPPDQLVATAPTLDRLPVDVVFDHFARIAPAGFHSNAAYAQVSRLLEQGKAWLKLSGAYMASNRSTDFDALAQALIACAPDRLLWGSNWPHPTATAGRHQLPDDADQLDALARWAGDDPTLKKILITNPARLYGFEPLSRH